jgi:transcription elongation factor Elf1
MNDLDDLDVYHFRCPQCSSRMAVLTTLQGEGSTAYCGVCKKATYVSFLALRTLLKSAMADIEVSRKSDKRAERRFKQKAAEKYAGRVVNRKGRASGKR